MIAQAMVCDVNDAKERRRYSHARRSERLSGLRILSARCGWNEIFQCGQGTSKGVRISKACSPVFRRTGKGITLSHSMRAITPASSIAI